MGANNLFMIGFIILFISYNLDDIVSIEVNNELVQRYLFSGIYLIGLLFLAIGYIVH